MSTHHRLSAQLGHVTVPLSGVISHLIPHAVASAVLVATSRLEAFLPPLAIPITGDSAVVPSTALSAGVSPTRPDVASLVLPSSLTALSVTLRGVAWSTGTEDGDTVVANALLASASTHRPLQKLSLCAAVELQLQPVWALRSLRSLHLLIRSAAQDPFPPLSKLRIEDLRISIDTLYEFRPQTVARELRWPVLQRFHATLAWPILPRRFHAMDLPAATDVKLCGLHPCLTVTSPSLFSSLTRHRKLRRLHLGLHEDERHIRDLGKLSSLREIIVHDRPSFQITSALQDVKSLSALTLLSATHTPSPSLVSRLRVLHLLGTGTRSLFRSLVGDHGDLPLEELACVRVCTPEAFQELIDCCPALVAAAFDGDTYCRPLPLVHPRIEQLDLRGADSQSVVTMVCPLTPRLRTVFVDHAIANTRTPRFCVELCSDGGLYDRDLMNLPEERVNDFAHPYSGF